jgi:hypothetical protein
MPRSSLLALAAIASLIGSLAVVPCSVVAQPTPVARPDVAVASAGETPAPTVAPIAPGRHSDRTYTFQLVLLLADNATPAVTESVPAKAQRALKDLQDFLPYKSYHLVDMAWLRTSRNASSQITGPKGESYVVDLAVLPSGHGERLLVQDFRITEVSMMPPPGASALSSPAPRAIGKLLSSTFGMELGETVVVGTAKIDGPGKALIVLLSALP